MTNGVGFLGLMALIFIGLKLAEVDAVAAWSWWAVLAPLWVPVAVVVAFCIPFYMAEAARKLWGRR